LDELESIIEKYTDDYIQEHIHSLDKLNIFAAVFFKDVSEIYDCITRVRNIELNPSGYSLDDAPIIGLLIKIWKLLKEIVAYYEKGNAEIISILERPLVESAITASYLIKSDTNVIEDYRKISYKGRLRILRELKNGDPFFVSKAGKRLLKSVQEKLELEGFDENSFTEQKNNRWKLQGKNFFEIFKEVEDEKLYTSTFGMMSESIHASWNDSLDWCLYRNDDNTFDPFPFYHSPDIRFLTTTLIFCNRPYKLWLNHIGITDKYLMDILQWVENINSILYVNFDNLYGNDHG
jgi:hypothetical protein